MKVAEDISNFHLDDGVCLKVRPADKPQPPTTNLIICQLWKRLIKNRNNEGENRSSITFLESMWLNLNIQLMGTKLKARPQRLSGVGVGVGGRVAFSHGK